MEVQSRENAQAGNPPLDTDTRVALYREMRRAQIVDARLTALGEAGEVGFVPRVATREAALIGTLAALREGDWVFPTMLDWPAAMFRGMSVATFVHRVFGSASDPLKGRDMPGGLSAKGLHIASVSAPAATHLPHAVGVGWAAQRRGEERVAACLFESAEVDAADFHTGLNFAGVMNAPTVFVCRVREGEEGAAEHAVAYGLPHASADGADLSAVFSVVQTAVIRAAGGGGSTVIDLALGGDPVAPLRRALDDLGAWSADKEAGHTKAVEDELAAAIDAASRAGEPSLRSLFDDVFAELPPHLVAQRDAALGR